MRIGSTALGFGGRDLHRRQRESNNVSNVRTLRSDNGTDRRIGNVHVCGFGLLGGARRQSDRWLVDGIRRRLILGGRVLWPLLGVAHAIAGGGHHRHWMEAGEHDALRGHGLDVVLVRLAQLQTDFGFGFGHTLDGSLDRDYPFGVAAGDVVDGADSDFGFGLCHDSLYGNASFANDATNQVVVSQHFEREFDTIRKERRKPIENHMLCYVPCVTLPFVNIVHFQLHNLQNTPACVGTVFRIPVDCDRLLHRSHVVLAMDVDASVTLLCDLSDRVSATANDGADHVTLDEQTQRKIRLASGTGHTGVRSTTAGIASFVHGFDVQTISSEFDTV